MTREATMTSSSPTKIAVLTTSRADYGLLRWVMRALDEAPDFELCVLAAGGHLSASSGASVDEIEADGFAIAEGIPFVLDADGAQAASTMVALATLGVSSALERQQPDWLIVLGDRFECLGPAQAAVMHKVPICHLCGGDITEGAIDDGIRHAITKLAHLHCVTNSDAYQRVVQMGEAPERVVLSGSSGLDGLASLPVMTRSLVHERAGLPERHRLLLITFHPETLAPQAPRDQVRALLDALANLPQEDTGLLFTGANFDPGAGDIMAEVRNFVAARDNAALCASLGQTLYLNALRHADAIVGNSSSGLYEAPSFGVPTVNIGDRQKGRLRAESIMDCEIESRAIRQTIDQALAWPHRDVVNPYGTGNASAKILEALRRMSQRPRLDILRKPFHNCA